MFFFLLFSFLLFLLNVALVLFIRRSRSFATLPGWIYTLLFLSFGSYLLYLLSLYPTLGPTPVRGYAHPQGLKITPNEKSDKNYLARSALIEKSYLQAKSERESRIIEDLGTVKLFLTYLSLQSVFACIAAIVGSRVVQKKANYYYLFAGLHLFLTLVTLAAKHLISNYIG
jgi:hypothetical protein